jgi:hypothetical protein
MRRRSRNLCLCMCFWLDFLIQKTTNRPHVKIVPLWCLWYPGNPCFVFLISYCPFLECSSTLMTLSFLCCFHKCNRNADFCTSVWRKFCTDICILRLYTLPISKLMKLLGSHGIYLLLFLIIVMMMVWWWFDDAHEGVVMTALILCYVSCGISGTDTRVICPFKKCCCGRFFSLQSHIFGSEGM